MSLGPVIIGVSGLVLTSDDVELLRHPAVGGVILFSRNFESPEQLTQLVAEIHGLRPSPLLVAVDHEGGRVQRFRDDFTPLPPASVFGKLYDIDRARGKRMAETAGWLMAAELRCVGVDFSFAPVLDLDLGISTVIGDRAFHQEPDAVAALAHRFVDGMKHAGMAATGKHFPGHGGVEVDSHLDTATDTRKYQDLAMADLIPFGRLIRWGLAAMMPAHVVYPEVDDAAAGFSRFWLHDILRERLGFQGLIFSDDLEMEGARVAGGLLDRAQAALTAGCDMVLVCNNPANMARIVEHCPIPDNPASQLRRTRMHGRPFMTRTELLTSEKWKQAAASVLELHSIE